MRTLECPKCGTVNEEDDRIVDAYNCTKCGCSYDLAYCEECEQYVGVEFWKTKCPLCGEELE